MFLGDINILKQLY